MRPLCSHSARLKRTPTRLPTSSQTGPNCRSTNAPSFKKKDVRLEAGVFAAQGFRMTRLEDRYLFLHQRFGGTELDRIVGWWAELSSAAELRNRLTHPKVVPQITVNAVQRAIQAIIDAIDSLFRAIYRKPFPARIRGLQSRLGF
jgi:hypothetical protein